MKIFELVKPGNSLAGGNVEWQSTIYGLLSNLESEYYDANIALNLFESMPPSLSMAAYKERMMRDRENLYKISKSMESEAADSSSIRDISSAAHLQAKRENWARENSSRLLEYKKRFLFAKTFIYALDSFEKTLKVLSLESGVSKEITALHLYMKEMFPDLQGIRDTAHHMEDRVRGLNKNKKPLDLKPVHFISPNGGVLNLGALVGSVYGTTMNDGSFGSVDISEKSMEIIQEILQNVFNSFEWWGWPVYLPYE